MRRKVGIWVAIAALLVWTAPSFAHEGEEHAEGSHMAEGSHAEQAEAGPSEAVGAEGQENQLTGEVVDVFCYLSHGKAGLGKGHAKCARKCIKNGLPVAIKVGNKLYLAAMEDHNPANETLANYAGRKVTVKGKVMERDGQSFISISSVEEAR